MKVFREYPAEVTWNLPLLLNNDRVCRDLHNTSKILFGKSPVTDVFGGVHCPWSGGRGSALMYNSRSVIDQNLIWYTNEGIRSWFTFSRHEISDGDLSDADMHSMILDFRREGFNVGYIVSDDKLKVILKELYGAVVKLSIVRASFEFNQTGDWEAESEFYHRKIDEGYDYVVPRCEFVKACPEKLADIADKCEVMVNQLCVPNCPAMLAHYAAIEKFEHDNDWQGFECFSRPTFLDVTRNVVFSYDEICELVKLGYRHFKLQGRGLTSRCALEYISDYVYEPTGPIRIVIEEILKRVTLDRSSGRECRF